MMRISNALYHHRSEADNANLTGRQPWLDVLRAIAVILVICHHLGYRFAPMPSDDFGIILRRIGWIGVDVFFVLSGFLIGQIFLNGKENCRSFIVKRVFRIFPAYYLALFMFFFLSLLGFGGENLSLFWSPLFILNGFIIPFRSENAVPFEILWSVTVEVFFYLLVGLFILFKRGGLIAFSLAMVFFQPFLRYLFLKSGFFNPEDLYFHPFVRLDAFSWGVILALILPRLPLRGSFLVFPLLLVLLGLTDYLSSISIKEPGFAVYGYSITSFVFASFLLLNGAYSKFRGLVSKNLVVRRVLFVLEEIGQRSYFFYLFHLFVISGLKFINDQIEIRYGLEVFGFWSASVACLFILYWSSILSWEWLEKPMIDLGRRFASGVPK